MSISLVEPVFTAIGLGSALTVFALVALAALAFGALAAAWLWRQRAIYAIKSEQSRISDMERHYQQVLSAAKDQFKALSEDVLREKKAQLEKESVVGVKQITDALRKDIDAFRNRVEDVNKADAERTARLKADIEKLVLQTNLVSEQADKLATAISSDAQVTGQWGEIQLKRVLELGGLVETVDFDCQETFTTPGSDHADMRTDVLVKMPGERWLVIDAKTTMAAYVDSVGAEGEAKENAVKRIIASVVEHVKEMKRADYHRKISAATGRRILNTMLMYIPFEEVYLIAMKSEVDTPSGKMPLRDWAWRNDVAFVNASSLMPIVRMLAELWARDRAEKRVMKIREAAEALVEKFNIFLSGGARRDGFYAIGESLAAAVAAYNQSLNRLCTGSGNVVRRLEGLKEMGVQAAASLPSAEAISAKMVRAEVAHKERVSQEGEGA